MGKKDKQKIQKLHLSVGKPSCSRKILGGVTRSKASAGQKTLGFLGGKGTSQPHLTIAPKIPANIPIKKAKV